MASSSKKAKDRPQKDQQQQKDKLAASLIAAAGEGKVELVRLLLRCGADVNAQDEQFGNTALHQAAWNGFSETVQVLCKHRANTSIRNKAQHTPLHMACQQGHNQTARLLLMANAKTEAKNSYGDTPLHTAARYGHAGVARILLSAKSNPNQVNKNHDTPLHIAAAMSRRKLTKIFVQNGAEPAIKNKQEETAMDIALRKNLIDIQELITNPPPVKPSHSHQYTHRDNRLSGSGGGGRHSASSPSPIVGETSNRLQQLDSQVLSRLERRYGQLYGSHQVMPATGDGIRDLTSGAAAVATRHRHHRHNREEYTRHRHHRSQQRLRHKRSSRYNLHYPMDNDENDTLSDGDDSEHEEDEEEEGIDLSETKPNELAVDVPPEMRSIAAATAANSNQSSKTKLVKQMQTTNALATRDERLMRTKSSENNGAHFMRAIRGNRLRTKTIGGCIAGSDSADLHLLPALMSSRKEPATTAIDSNQQRPLEASQRAQSGVCLAPDARDDQQMNLMMMGCFNGTGSGDSNNKQQQQSAKSASPQGSLRSSRSSRASKSRGLTGRLFSGRHKHRKSSGGPTLIVRRPNGAGLKVGGCKLSLLRVAQAGNSIEKATNQDEEKVDFEVEEAERKKVTIETRAEVDTEQKQDIKSEIIPIVESLTVASAAASTTTTTTTTTTTLPTATQQVAVALGRRQERQEQQQQVAPNGTPLTRTRPLAPLSDESQLYAIPRKPKANNQQGSNKEPQVVDHFRSSDLYASSGGSGNGLGGIGGRLASATGKLSTITETSTTGAASSSPPKGDTRNELDELRVVSGGPALTSDGGHTSGSSSPSDCGDSSGNKSTQLSKSRTTPPSGDSSSSAIASSSDECVELISLKKQHQQHQATNVQLIGVRDLYATPGYSTITGSASGLDVGAHSGNNGAQTEVECLCPQLLGLDASTSRQQQRGGEGDTQASFATVAGAMQEQQVVAGGGINGGIKSSVAATATSGNKTAEFNANIKSETMTISTNGKTGAEDDQVASSNSNSHSHSHSSGGVGKLRQLFHLESRASKDRKSLSALASSATSKGTTTTTTTSGQLAGQDKSSEQLRSSGNNSNSNGIDNKSASPPVPMSAIAGGYYAYSPVTLASHNNSPGFVSGFQCGNGITSLRQVDKTEPAKSAKTLPSDELGAVAMGKLLQNGSSNNKLARDSNSNGNSNSTNGNKKSWLLSKFSLSTSSSNVNQQQQQQQQNGNGISSSGKRGNKLPPTNTDTAAAGRQAKLDSEHMTINGSGDFSSRLGVLAKDHREQQESSLYGGREVNASDGCNMSSRLEFRATDNKSNGRRRLDCQDRELCNAVDADHANDNDDHDYDDDDDDDKETAIICSSNNNKVEQQQNCDADNNLKQDKTGDKTRHQLLLIRPKSALSATNLELIKAQKSLALAAAAKVQQQSSLRNKNTNLLHATTTTTSTSAEGQLKVEQQQQPPAKLLTVKTSQEHPAFWHHHASLAGHNHNHNHGHQLPRSGTNSAGISDSSPSNNGAESDNSIQTTLSGSMNTQQPVAVSIRGTGSNKNPLNILSRILSNGNNLVKSKSSATNTSSNSSSSTLRQQHQTKGGSLSSSPGSASSNTTASVSQTSSAECQLSPSGVSNESSNQSSISQLDQLSSRSRCPIVVMGNGLSRPTESTAILDNSIITTTTTTASNLPPKLPPKGVLKTTNLYKNNNYQHYNSYQQQPPVAAVYPSLESSMTMGLPRVASCGQLSYNNNNENNKQEQHQFNQQQLYSHLMMAHHYNADQHHNHNHQDQLQASLCNYHALSRSQPFQAQYSPYLPYALGRYSIHEPCDPAAVASAVATTTTTTATSGSVHDLSGVSTANATIDSLNDNPRLPINYNYYMNTEQYHPAGYPQRPPVEQNLYPSRQQHDSIYMHQLPYASHVANKDSLASSQHPTGRLAYETSYLHHHNHQQRRPKSSLDTFLLSGIHHDGDDADNTIDVVRADQQQQHQQLHRDNYRRAMTSLSHHNPRVTNGNHEVHNSSGSFYTQNNSIYAGEQHHHNASSELTVLPANPVAPASNEGPPPSASGGSGNQRARSASSMGKILADAPGASKQVAANGGSGQRNSWTSTPYKSLVHINQSPTSATNGANSTGDKIYQLSSINGKGNGMHELAGSGQPTVVGRTTSVSINAAKDKPVSIQLFSQDLDNSTIL